MNEEAKCKLTTQATLAKNKALASFARCKAKTVSPWKSGRKGKAVCIAGAVVLLFLMMCGCGGSDSAKHELENPGKMDDSGKLANQEKLGDPGELSAANISDQRFSRVFTGNSQDDEGVIYVHIPDSSIRIFQATSGGLLVGYARGTSQLASQVENFMGNLGASFDRIVWIATKSTAHEENQPLRKGFFVRRGKHSFVGTDGGEHVLAQYVEITDEKDIAMIMDELKRREEEKEAEKERARALVEEHGAIELDIPIPSLCGFKLGVPPSQVKPLLVNNDGTPLKVLDTKFAADNPMRLATPFRLFTRAEVHFSFAGKGKHLQMVTFRADDLNSAKYAKYTRESVEDEIENTVRMMEKKFGIEFKRTSNSFGRDYYWSHERGGECVEYIAVKLWGSQLSMTFSSFLVSKLEMQQLEAGKKSIAFDADAGADQL